MTDTTNPKDLVGSAKLPIHLFPPIAIAHGAVGMLEGRTKYGRANFRGTPVRASIYFDAAVRHLLAWMEGENYTLEGGHHLGNALATIAIILDAQTHGTLIDDRNFLPAGNTAFYEAIQELTVRAQGLVAGLKAKMAEDGKEEPHHFTALDKNESIGFALTEATNAVWERVNKAMAAVGKSVTAVDHGLEVEATAVAGTGSVHEEDLRAIAEKMERTHVWHADPNAITNEIWEAGKARLKTEFEAHWAEALRRARTVHPDEAMQLQNYNEAEMISKGLAKQAVMNRRHTDYVRPLLTEEEMNLFRAGMPLEEIRKGRDEQG